MNVEETILSRRSYRSLSAVDISGEMIDALAESARLAPSCFNNQPWRYVFAHEAKVLEELSGALSRGNAWAAAASLIIAVCSRVDLDCVVKEREYYLFDTGMASAFLLLRAAEMGLVAHPIAGFDAKKVKGILAIPDEMHLITLIIVGARSTTIGPLLSEKQAAVEKERPERLPRDAFAFVNRFHEKRDDSLV